MGYKKRNPTESNSPYEARAKSPFRELDDNNLRLNVNMTKQMTSVLDGNMKIKVNEEDIETRLHDKYKGYEPVSPVSGKESRGSKSGREHSAQRSRVQSREGREGSVKEDPSPKYSKYNEHPKVEFFDPPKGTTSIFFKFPHYDF